jgi:hypothetical protein
MSSRYFSELQGNDKLQEEQHAFLERLSDLLESLQSGQVAVEKLSGRVRFLDKTKALLEVTVPHRHDHDLSLSLTVEPGSIVVGYGWYDHVHFGNGESKSPLDEALEFVRDLIKGNVEVEITYGWLWTKVRTRRRVSGEWVALAVAFTPAIFAGGFRWPPRPREVRRISFM